MFARGNRLVLKHAHEENHAPRSQCVFAVQGDIIRDFEKYKGAVEGKVIQLKNGVPVLLEKNANETSACFSVWMQRGSRDEKPSEAGLSHLVEHMIYKGAGPNCEIKPHTIEGVGGYANANTSREEITYYAIMPSSQAVVGAEVIAKSVISPSFPEEGLATEKGVVLSEFGVYNDDPELKTMVRLNGLLWSAPFGRDELGSKKVVREAERSTIVKFHEAHYHAGNFFVVVTGNFDESAVMNVLEKTIGETTNRGPAKKRRTPALYTGKEHLRIYLDNVHLTFGAHAQPSGSIKDVMTAEAMNIILGGTATASRLFEEIREKRGLAYSISTGFEFYSDVGVYSIYCDPTPKNALTASQVVMREVGKISATEPTEHEVHMARNQLIYQAMSDLHNSDNRMWEVGDWFQTTGRYVGVDELIAHAKEVIAADITLAAKRIFGDELSLVSAGKGPGVHQKDLRVRLEQD